MLQFTTPQSGDPQKNKSAIAYQVRQHAAKVAAARQRKFRRPLHTADSPGGLALPVETCFLLSLDNDTEKSRQVSAEVVRRAGERADGGRDPREHRPKWTSVYRLDMAKKMKPKANAKIFPAATYSSPSTESSGSEVDGLGSDNLECASPYMDDLSWPGPLDSFFDLPFDPAFVGTPADTGLELDGTSYQSLLTSGKHIPDVLASLLAFELGSGFRELNFLPESLRQAQRTAAGATVALDQYQRRSLGAPLLEDIFEEAEQSSRAFQEFEISTFTATAIEGLLAECCRLAGLAFCELVLFPSLSDHGTIVRLTGDLQTALETVDFWLSGEDCTPPVLNMLVWATTLGAMTEPPGGPATSRGWFVRRLSQLLSSEKWLSDWQVVQSVLSKFLWWQPVCDQPGRQVWIEASEIGQLATASEFQPYNGGYMS